jgi:hypothetical protein
LFDFARLKRDDVSKMFTDEDPQEKRSDFYSKLKVKSSLIVFRSLSMTEWFVTVKLHDEMGRTWGIRRTQECTTFHQPKFKDMLVDLFPSCTIVT